jgi:hypothetical protein
MARAAAGPPLVGAYICPVVSIDANATTSTAKHAELDLPVGMSAVLVGVSAHAHSVTSNPAVEVGTAADPNGYVTATNLTTAANRIYPDGALAANSRASVSSGTPIVVTVTNDAADNHGVVNVGLWLYVTAHAGNTITGLSGGA